MGDGCSNTHVDNSMKAVEYDYVFQGDPFDWTRLARPNQLPSPTLRG